jgi:F0F1-type ATP synthase assembly protein I
MCATYDVKHLLLNIFGNLYVRSNFLVALESWSKRRRFQKLFFLGLQILLTAGMALTCWLIFNQSTAYAVLLGGSIAVLGSLYMFARSFSQGDSRQLLWAFYRAEMGKWLLTIFLFILIFKFLNVNFLYVFLGYLTAQSAFWIALLNKV